MRYYSKRRPQNIIIPIYPAAVFAGDQIQKLGDIKYIYYPDNNTYAQATGVYAESSGGTISCEAGQSILTISTDNEVGYFFSLSYVDSIGQTIEAQQGDYYFVIPGNVVFVALEDGTVVSTIRDAQNTSGVSPYAYAVFLRSMYGLNLQIE